MDITAQVVNVTTRTTTNGRVAYDVALSTGQTYQAWDGNLARQLQAYVLQNPVTLRIRQKPSRDGQRMWEDITAFAPPGQALGPDTGGQQQQQFAGVPQGPQAPYQASPQFQPTPPRETMAPDAITRITKMGCLGYAADLVGHLMQGAGPEGIVEATNTTLRVAEIFYKRARSHEDMPQNAPGAPLTPADDLGGLRTQAALTPPLTGAQIASGIPGVQLGAPVQADVDEYPDDPVTGSDSGWD